MQKKKNLRVAVHDYGGHPFSFDLCAALSEQGYTLLYVYTSACRSPNAQNKKRHQLFYVKNIICADVQKENFVTRFLQESRYGSKVVSLFKRWKPDVVISSTTPLAAQRKITSWTKANGVISIFWFQDIISIAAKQILPGKIGHLGKWAALGLERIEKNVLRHSDAVIVISDDFNVVLKKWKIKGPEVVLIPNWAVIEKLPVVNKNNAWAIKHDLQDKFCFIYTGTLGMKHNPHLILRLAEHFLPDKQVRIVVISEKMGADWLRKEKEIRHLDNLMTLNFQPFEMMPNVLGTADVLISILNDEASAFCVPSKVLSYLCASRPLLLAVSSQNLASKIVLQNAAGLVVPPEDEQRFIEAAEHLRNNPEECKAMGQSARKYAENTFNRKKVALSFETLIQNLSESRGEQGHARGFRHVSADELAKKG